MIRRLLYELDARSTFERRAFRLMRARMLRRLPRGDGRRVIVFPGHSNDATETEALRRFLDELGHRSEDWGLGVNAGPTPDVEAGLVAMADGWSDDEPVALIGLSLGGVYARALARHRPAAVRQVITMGTPMRDDLLLGGASDSASVPTTAVWSRFDQFVDPATTRLPVGADHPHHENVHVIGGHCGMVINPLALRVVADRLG